MPKLVHLPIQVAFVERRIHVIRGLHVMLDRDLAELYLSKPIALRQQVRRNIQRFPDDFMIQLTTSDVKDLILKGAIPSKRHLGGTMPYAFTQEGVAMLSSVLKSARAVQVNVAIMRAFVQLNRTVRGNRELASRIHALERKYAKHDREIQVVFDAFKEILAQPARQKRRIGFSHDG